CSSAVKSRPQPMRLQLLKYRGLLISVYHLVVIAASFAGAWWIRFDFSELVLNSPILLSSFWVVIAIKMVTFIFGGLQKGWWRYAGLADLLRIFVANVIASTMSATVLFVKFGGTFPRSIYVIDFLLCFLITAGSRFCVRLYNETLRFHRDENEKGILI